MEGTEALQAYSKGEITLDELALIMALDRNTAKETADHLGFSPKKNGPNKFHAETVVYEGILFASQKEFRRYFALKISQDQGEIHDLRVHPQYTVFDGFKTKQGTRVAAITYKPDFDYLEGNTRVVEEVKSKPTMTTAFRIVMKLFLYRYPEIDYRIITEA